MLRKKGMEKLHVNIGNYSSIYFKTEDRRFDTLFRVSELSEIQEDSRIEYLKIENTVIKTQKAKDERECIYFYYEDPFIGIQILSEIISDFFSIPIYHLYLSGDENKKYPRRAIDWVMSRQETIAECNMECWETNEEDLTYFLDTARITKYLVVFVETSDDFQYSFKYPMNLDSMTFVASPWPTVTNLLEINPGYLEILTTKFTSEDMNLFVRNWINGGNSNLRSLIFVLNQVDIQTILNGIPAGFMKMRNHITSIEIRNVNGVIASIVTENGNHKDFCIYVWPDYKGQPYPLEPIV
uniref:FBA_2 domain-containing protein n=1 Tax=Caenorhabditis tropicalis TaxID=1561998 RepID=A0A1I7UMK1_9PELO